MALGYLDGTDGGPGFSNKALVDDVVKADQNLTKAIMAGGVDGKKPSGFIGVMLAMGRVELQADGLYRLVQA